MLNIKEEVWIKRDNSIDKYILEYISNIKYDSPYKFDDETNRKL